MDSIFKSVFMKQLPSQDLPKLGKSITKSPHMHLKTKRHHGKPWTGVNRLSQNILPASHRTDPNEIAELEQLKRKESGISVLSSPANLQRIITMFNLQNLNQQHPKTLGNTGIVIFFNPDVGSYCLKK